MRDARGAVLLSLIGLLSVSAVPAVESEAFEARGLSIPFRTVEVAASADGVVSELSFERGELVEKGQVLARLDFSVQLASLKVAEARAARRSPIEKARVELEYARRRLKQFDEMHAQDVVSTSDFDEVRRLFALASVALQEANENQRVAELEARQARARWEQSVIRSPITGFVSMRGISVGELASRTGKSVICTLVALDPLIIQTHLPLARRGQVRPGQQVEIRFGGGLGSSTGTVTLVDRVVDPASDTFEVRVSVPNPEGRIPSGLSCEMTFRP